MSRRLVVWYVLADPVGWSHHRGLGIVVGEQTTTVHGLLVQGATRSFYQMVLLSVCLDHLPICVFGLLVVTLRIVEKTAH